MTSYKDIVYAFDMLTLRNAVFFLVFAILAIVWYHGNILWCVFVAVVSVTSYYLIKTVYKRSDPVDSALDIQDLVYAEGLEDRMKVILQKWKTLGSPTYLKKDLDLINFFHAIKVWKYYSEDAFTETLEIVEEIIETYELTSDNRNTLSKLRLRLLDTFSSFTALNGYDVAKKRLESLVSKYIDTQ